MFGATARKLFERMMPLLLEELASVPVAQRRAVASLLELESRAADVVVEPPFAPLFLGAAEEFDIPAELLVAIAAEMSNFNPSCQQWPDRFGIMGLPIDAVPDGDITTITATIAELRAHDAGALERVRRCVLAAAEELARLRRLSGSLMGAVKQYAHGRTPAVVGFFFLYVGGSVEPDKLEALARMIRGSADDAA